MGRGLTPQQYRSHMVGMRKRAEVARRKEQTQKAALAPQVPGTRSDPGAGRTRLRPHEVAGWEDDGLEWQA